MNSNERTGRIARLSRRRLLRGLSATAVAGGMAGAIVGRPALGAFGQTTPVAAAAGQSRWLGPDLWANRLTDWARNGAAYACVAEPGRRTLCTASLLTSRLSGGAARLSVRIRTARTGVGFSGFLIGCGTDEEHRRTALVGSASGTGGGLLAVLADDGSVGFREHTDETNQFAYARQSSRDTGPARAMGLNQDHRLLLAITVNGSGSLKLTLTGYDPTGGVLSTAVLRDVDPSLVAGGVSLVSAALEESGPTYSLNGLLLSGPGVLRFPERGLGPVIGTLFSQSAGVLKMTAQVAPFLVQAGDEVMLETRRPDGSWMLRTSSPVGAGYAAALRVEGWDASRATAYRVSHSRGGPLWSGTVPAEPSGTRLRIATINCSKAAMRPLDISTPIDDRVSDGAPLPLYTAANVYFPYEQALAAVAAQLPDLLVAMGDQYYEDSPTAEDETADPELDQLYKYLQWVWAVRDLTKNLPTLVLVDDHDVFQGNLWGEGGIAAPFGFPSQGGYERIASWVNLIQRMQCGHNPDPVDPAPVAQGITVWFTHFTYAGVIFALLEDRKFKTSPDGVNGQPDARLELLGPRQETMLAQVASQAGSQGRPVVVLTQTVYACVETKTDGTPGGMKDSGGFPKEGRERALAAIRRAGGVILSGDTHLSHVVRHLAIPGVGQGPLQFTGPALGSSYQRWFTPSQRLPGATLPNTGKATDALGNQFRVLAIANPKVSKAEVAARGDGFDVGDRALKQEGYGIVDVDLAARTYRFESWPGNVDPLDAASRPFPGWPYTLSFDDA